MPGEDLARAISLAKKKRGIAKASISRLYNKLEELECNTATPRTLLLAQQILKNIETCNSDFTTQHYALVDLPEDEEALTGEQAILDAHDDNVTDIIT